MTKESLQKAQEINRAIDFNKRIIENTKGYCSILVCSNGEFDINIRSEHSVCFKDPKHAKAIIKRIVKECNADIKELEQELKKL